MVGTRTTALSSSRCTLITPTQPGLNINRATCWFSFFRPTLLPLILQFVLNQTRLSRNKSSVFDLRPSSFLSTLTTAPLNNNRRSGPSIFGQENGSARFGGVRRQKKGEQSQRALFPFPLSSSQRHWMRHEESRDLSFWLSSSTNTRYLECALALKADAA